MQLMPETGHGFAETSGLARRLSFRRARRQRMLQHESRLNRKQLPTDLSRKANPSQPAVASPPADHPNSRKRNVQKTLVARHREHRRHRFGVPGDVQDRSL